MSADAAPQTVCQCCGKRPATETWVGEGGVLALVHRMSASWCLPCCLRAQITHAERAAASLPELRAELASLDGGEPVRDEHALWGALPSEMRDLVLGWLRLGIADPCITCAPCDGTAIAAAIAFLESAG